MKINTPEERAKRRYNISQTKIRNKYEEKQMYTGFLEITQEDYDALVASKDSSAQTTTELLKLKKDINEYQGQLKIIDKTLTDMYADLIVAREEYDAFKTTSKEEKEM